MGSQPKITISVCDFERGSDPGKLSSAIKVEGGVKNPENLLSMNCAQPLGTTLIKVSWLILVSEHRRAMFGYRL